MMNSNTIFRALGRNGQWLVVAALLLIAMASGPNFFTRFNLSSLAFQYSVIGLMALGQFPVILTRNIDLSQAGIMALVAVLAALAAQSQPLGVALMLGLLAGAGLGLANGLLVAFTKIPSFVVTLAAMSICRGLALSFSGGAPVPFSDPGFMSLARLRILDVPAGFVLFLVIALLLAVFTTQWPLGRLLYAMGGHPENARLSGLRLWKGTLSVYVFSGVMSALAGLLLAARTGTGHPLSATGYELISISAVIIGGVSLFGGIGRASGVVAGVLILAILEGIITQSGISPYVQGAVKGSIVLMALSASQYLLGRTPRT